MQLATEDEVELHTAKIKIFGVGKNKDGDIHQVICLIKDNCIKTRIFEGKNFKEVTIDPSFMYRNRIVYDSNLSITYIRTFIDDLTSKNNIKMWSIPNPIKPLDYGSKISFLGEGSLADVFQNWTFWKKLPLNISESSEQPLKAIYVNSRPYLYWIQSQKTEFVSGSKTHGAGTKVETESNEQKHMYCSYQHLDGGWEAPQLLPEVFDPQDSSIKIDNHGKYNASGNSDPNPLGLLLIDVLTLKFPDHLNIFLTDLYLKLNTQSMDQMFLVNQGSLKKLSVDDLWGQYYWELMYFSPLTMANVLQTTQQYDKALTWYKGVFNPSRRRSDSISPFVFAPFEDASGNNILGPLLNTRYLNDLHLHAFEAHRMAQLRGSLPYKKYMVMRYIQNLLAWGDSLFKDNTRESITEAMSRYFSASDLLGNSPRKLYSATYDDSTQHSTVYDLFKSMVKTASSSPESALASQLLVIYPYNYSVASYFRVPENREFMALWSNVGDRLYKIRNCLSIAGLKQQLALLSPAIDPHDLVRAVATRGGEFVREMLDEISDKNRPPYRFLVLLERAKEFASFVERLGDSFLSMLERKDNAYLVKLSNTFSEKMLDMMTQQKKAGITQAMYDQAMLKKRRESIQTRIDYYTGLLPNNGVSSEEAQAERLLFISSQLNARIHVASLASHFAGLLPQVGSPFAMTFGGEQLKFGCAVVGSALATVDSLIQYRAGHLQRADGQNRRYAEWQLQLSLAKKEQEELSEQEKAAALRLGVAQEELNQHNKSIEHQKEVSAYNSTQFTNVDLYAWYVDQLYDLLTNAYYLAMRIANQAAYAYKYELGVASNVSLTGFWSSSRRGLLSGTKLMQQLHQMQQDYLENNKRLPEIEKTLSLRDILSNQTPEVVWPDNLTDALENGLSFTLVPALFDDFSSFFREEVSPDNITSQLVIKMVSISVPALSGPNQQVNLVLTNDNTYADKICISRGVSATGMFSASLDDARYLPFEGQVLVDTTLSGKPCPRWTLQLAGTPPSEDFYNSVSDIHLRILYVVRTPSTTLSASL